MPLNPINTTSAFQFFQVARYAALLIGSIVLAKSGISQHDIGVYETVLLLSGSLSFFWINGILTNFLRSYSTSENKREILSNTAYFIFILTVLIVIMAAVFRTALQNFFSLDESYFQLFLVFFFFNNIVFLTEYLLLAKEKTQLILFLGIFHLLIQSGFIAVPAFFYQNLEFVILGLLAFVTLKFIVFMLVFIESRPTPLNIKLIWKELSVAAPLILSFFLGGISIYVDGIIINAYFDKTTFAIYQYGAKEFPVTLLLANALSVALVKNISSNFQTGVLELKQRSLKLMHILFPVSILLVATSKFLYPLVFSNSFSESYLYFNMYLLLIIPRLLFPQTILNALGKNKIILYATSVEFILNIVFSLLLLRLIGPVGVAFGTLLAFIVERIILVWSVQKINVRMQEYIPLKPMLLYSCILIVVFIVSLYLNSLT
ncbi:MAG: polysaccharide biosynthesis C-terminal domain-containing protein [Chitinophagales bacterium]